MTNKRSSRQNVNTENLVDILVPKTTLRHDYLLEREKIKSEIGDLERIRLNLGLSQRRICMLLLVDPSAWTRWIKTEAPPHVYQALRWLLELRKVNPEITAPNNIESRVDLMHSATQSKIKHLENSVEMLERSMALAKTIQPITQPDLTKLFDTLASRLEVAAPRKVMKRAKKQAKKKLKKTPAVRTKGKKRTQIKLKAKLKSKKRKHKRKSK